MREQKQLEYMCTMIKDRYLFKAQRINNGLWITGNRIDDGVTGQVFIHPGDDSVNESNKVGEDGCLRLVACEVEPSTVCECTGLTDKDDTLIWENDIVEILSKDGRFVIEWSDTEAKWQMHNFEEGYTVDFDNYWSHEVEVISNKFNNPELLESEETI